MTGLGLILSVVKPRPPLSKQQCCEPSNKGSFPTYQDNSVETDQLLVVFEAIFESWYREHYRTYIRHGSWPRYKHSVYLESSIFTRLTVTCTAL
jgi:hypothetical protein